MVSPVRVEEVKNMNQERNPGVACLACRAGVTPTRARCGKCAAQARWQRRKARHDGPTD
jgi:hypothetical protein